MIMLSNCRHTQEHILPRLVQILHKNDYPETDRVLRVNTTYMI